MKFIKLLLDKKKYLIISGVCLFLLDYLGIFAHLFERDFETNFHYPYEGDISPYILQLEQKLKPDLDPIYTYNYSYLFVNEDKCKGHDNIRLVYVIKSSLENFSRRNAIRKTWGFEKRFSDVVIRRIFILGVTENEGLMLSISDEINQYNDIVQVDFIDSYFNNTIKTMTAIYWLIHFCPNSRYYYFSDDDMYVSTKNVLRYLRNPTNYPGYLKSLKNFSKKKNAFISSNKKTELNFFKSIPSKLSNYNFDLPENVLLYTGCVINSSPLRLKNSKWYISLKEYPYNSWPPYIPAGAYILSRKALFKMYYSSLYTKHFRFDDIYLAIVALKAGIQPYHCNEFYMDKVSDLHSFKYIIASHGFEDPKELEKVWNEQKEAGNA